MSQPKRILMTNLASVSRTVGELLQADCQLTDGGIAQGNLTIHDGSKRVFHANRRGVGWVLTLWDSEEIKWRADETDHKQ